MPIKGINGEAARQWFRENVLPDVSVTSVTLTESVLRIAPNGVYSYPVDATGVTNAFSDAAEGHGIVIPGTTIDMGTTPLTLPKNASLWGINKRKSVLSWDEGVGDALTVGAHAHVEEIRLLGPNSATSTDQGIVGVSNEGSGRFVNVIVQGFARAIFLDGYFNSVWYGLNVSQTDGDQTGLSGKGGCMVFDTASGSNNNSRVIAPYFSNNTEGPCINAGGNEIFVMGYQGENNEAGALKSVGDNWFHMPKIQNLTGGTGIDLDFGENIVTGVWAVAGGSGQTAINASLNADEGKVAGPFILSGWNTDFSGFQAATSVEQRNSS